MERLQKVLAAAGIASRRRAEVLISDGRVTVNGALATLGMSVDAARDVVKLDGERVGAAALVYWLLHKPEGVLATVRDPQRLARRVRAAHPPNERHGRQVTDQDRWLRHRQRHRRRLW